jgi:TP901 family phage tail tape measure protein
MASAGEIKARLTLDSKSFQAGMAQARSEMATTSKAAQNTKKSLTGIQTGAAIVATGVVASLAAATMAAAGFEKQLSAIESVSGASGSEMEELSALIMKLGESSVYSANEVGIAAEELIKAGVSLEDIMGGALAGSLDLASAGSLALGDAAEIASTALNAFKSDGLEVSDAANILAGAANASATSVGEMKFGLSAVSAVASGAGMTFKDTATALAVFAQNGLKGSDAGTSLKTMLMNLSPSTKEATAVFKELGIITKDGSNQFYDAQGNLKSLADVTDILRDSLIKLNPKERGEALKTMFGADAVRSGTILFKEGADGIEKMASAMDKIKAADVAKVKLDNLIGSFEEFKGALETAGIKIGNEFLPVFKEIVKGGTEVIRMFSSLDPGVVATGLKMAAAGSGVALLLSTIGKLSIALRGLYVSLGPGGWLILGVSALAAAYVGYNDAANRNAEVSLDQARALAEQEKSLSTTISRFEDLRAKSQLTSDEFERMIDLQTEMANTTDKETLEYLGSLYEELREKSGLTNDEIAEYLKLNDELIEKVPSSTLKITEKGKALVAETDAARAANAEQRERLRTELELQLAKAEANYEENLVKERDLVKDIKEINKERLSIDQQISDKQAEISMLEGKIEEAKRRGKEEYITLFEQDIQRNKETINLLKDQNVELIEQIQKKENSLDKTREEIGKLSEVKQEMVNIELATVGINNRKGNGLKLIDSEIAKLEAQRKKITEGTSAKDRQNAEYQETISKIDSEISGLKRARENVESITGEQSRTNSKIREGATAADILQRKLGMDVTKKVTVVGGNAEAQRLHELLSQPAYKTVYVNEANLQRGMRQNERAYNNTRHQGGTLHDLIPKFHEGGSPALSLPASHHEVDVRLLRNEMVLTEAQQASLFRMLDAPTVSDSDSAPAFNPQELSAIKSLLGVIADNTAQGASVYLDGKELTNTVDWLQAVRASNDYRTKGGKA